MVVRVSDKKQTYNNVTKLLVKPLKKIRLLHSGHMGLGVWNPKACLEKREVVLRLRQNTWKKYKCVFEELKMVRRPNL